MSLNMSNVSAGVSPSVDVSQLMGVAERALLAALITLPCVTCLTVNLVLSVVLRGQAQFRESARYLLLLNLLLADTAQLGLSQLLYLAAAARLRLSFPACGVLNMAAKLSSEVSPLTLVAMALERYVAVCFPLRHGGLATRRNALAAILAAWSVSGANVLTRVLLLLDLPFRDLQSLMMRDFCSDNALLVGAASRPYDLGFTCFLFAAAAAALVFSFAGVAAAAARSAGSDAAAARRACGTILLHLAQLALSLSSTIHNPLLSFLFPRVGRLVFVRLQAFLYTFVFILPHCLSALIYGLRDQRIRPVLLRYLCCRRDHNAC